MKPGKPLQVISQFIVVLIFVYAALFGAWLAGAKLNPWAFVLGAWFSALLVAAVNIFGARK